METPIFLGIDPGYATMGLVALDADGNVQQAVAFRTDPGEGDIRARCRKMALEMTTRLLPWCDKPVVICIEEYRSSRTSKISADTHYGRGVIDGVLLHLLARPRAIIVPQTRVKAFCHPRGVASDKGRTKDLEYRGALNMLDMVIAPNQLDRIAKPDLTCDAGAWKQGRLHTLDAAALAGIARLVVQQGHAAHSHQREIANQFLGLSEACPANLTMRTL